MDVLGCRVRDHTVPLRDSPLAGKPQDRLAEVPRLRAGTLLVGLGLALSLMACAIVPAPGGGRIVTAGHHILINHTEDWTVTSVTPMALDDSVAWTMTDVDLTMTMDKDAGEGRKIGLFSALIGMVGSFAAGLAVAP